MTHQASRTAPPSLPPPDRLSIVPAWGEVGELVRRFCAVPGRFGFRVGGLDCVGHVFIAGGRVIHAEYGEDYGLDALMQMLRAGPLWIESWTGPWPRQGTMHLSADVLLGSTLRPGPGTESIAPAADTGVVRKVVLPEPSPLPLFDEDDTSSSVTLSTRLARALSVAPPPLQSSPPPLHSSPPPLPSTPRGAAQPVAASPVPSRPPMASQLLPARPSTPPVYSLPPVSHQAVSQQAVSQQTSPQQPMVTLADADVESDADAEDEEVTEAEPATTMVRLTSRGLLLAASGENVAQLADAASLIHGLANLIAVDLGRRRTAAVHLRGGTKSLFVTRSEVHDIAAVCGSTRRLGPLLTKVGLR